MSQGTLYYHIGSKTNALVEIHNAFVDEMITRLSAVHDSPLSVEERLKAFIEVMLSTVVTNRKPLAVFLRERRSLPVDARNALR